MWTLKKTNFKYSIKDSSGRTCCQSDNPNNLCPKCRVKAGFAVDLPKPRLSLSTGNEMDMETFLESGTPDEKKAWMKLIAFLFGK